MPCRSLRGPHQRISGERFCDQRERSDVLDDVTAQTRESDSVQAETLVEKYRDVVNAYFEKLTTEKGESP